MKKCPNCGELIGDSVTKCFSCFFDMTNPEANKLAEQNRIQKEREALEKKQKEDAERQRLAEENRIKAIREKNERIFSLNDLYEYDIVSIPDLQSGESNTSIITSVITQHAQNGWRLHTIYTNEIGKTSQPQVFSFTTINATIEQTIIIFERVIAKANS